MKITDFSLFVLTFAFCCVANTFGSRIYNQNYKRSVYLTGSIVREEHLIEVVVEDSSPLPSPFVPPELSEEIHQNWAPNYVFLVPKWQNEQIASWEANLIVDANENSIVKLPMTEITSEMKHCQEYFYLIRIVSL